MEKGGRCMEKARDEEWRGEKEGGGEVRRGRERSGKERRRVK